MNDTERLSMLLSGELSPVEEAELRAEIAANPDLAAQWRLMRGLPDALGDLAEPVPPALDAAVLAPKSPKTRPSAGWAVAALAVAALLFFALRPPERPDLVLLEGTELVSGDLRLMAADVPIALDGTARISVEPRAGALRESGAEENMKNIIIDKKSAVAAAVGAVVTVAVLEGTARIGDADAVEVSAGQEHTVRPDAELSSRTPRRKVVHHDDRGATDAEAQERIEALEAELAELKLRQAYTSGRLKATQGEPVDWPADLPAAFGPDGFRAGIEGLVADTEGLELLSVDCDEFPCLAYIRSDLPRDADLREVYGPFRDSFEGDVSVLLGNNRTDNEHGSLDLHTIAVYPEAADDDAVRTRVQFREQAGLEDHQAELLGGPPQGEDHDVER